MERIEVSRCLSFPVRGKINDESFPPPPPHTHTQGDDEDHRKENKTHTQRRRQRVNGRAMTSPLLLPAFLGQPVSCAGSLASTDCLQLLPWTHFPEATGGKEGQWRGGGPLLEVGPRPPLLLTLSVASTTPPQRGRTSSNLTVILTFRVPLWVERRGSHSPTSVGGSFLAKPTQAF